MNTQQVAAMLVEYRDLVTLNFKMANRIQTLMAEQGLSVPDEQAERIANEKTGAPACCTFQRYMLLCCATYLT